MSDFIENSRNGDDANKEAVEGLFDNLGLERDPLPLNQRNSNDDANISQDPLVDQELTQKNIGKQEEEKVDDKNQFVLPEIDETAQCQIEEELSPLELDERVIEALDLKEDANKLYVDKRIQEALDMYTQALTVCPISRRKERAALYGNRSACCVQLGQHKIAIRECTKALELDARYMKVLKRRAKAYEKTEQLEQALEDYKKILEIDPTDHVARERVFSLPREINERNEKLKTEMMGKLKDLGNMFLKPFGLSTNNFQLNQDPNTGGYNIQFSQNGSSSDQ